MVMLRFMLFTIFSPINSSIIIYMSDEGGFGNHLLLFHDFASFLQMSV